MVGGKQEGVGGWVGDSGANIEKRLMKKRAMEEWLMIVQLLLSWHEEESRGQAGGSYCTTHQNGE